MLLLIAAEGETRELFRRQYVAFSYAIFIHEHRCHAAAATYAAALIWQRAMLLSFIALRRPLCR